MIEQGLVPFDKLRSLLVGSRSIQILREEVRVELEGVPAAFLPHGA